MSVDLSLSAWKLFSQLRKTDSIFSPASILFALSIVHQGANGNTNAQLNDFFGGKFDIAELQSLKDSLDDNGLLFVRNSCIVTDKLSADLNSDLMTSLQSISSITVENFNEPETIRKSLNAMIEEQTHGLIKGVVQRIDRNTVMLIVNTVYFKAKWKFKFEPNKTNPNASFYSAEDKKSQTVTMMAMKELKRVPYFENKSLQLVELPYFKPSSTSNSDFVMGFVLPKNRNQRFTPDNELLEFIDQLTTENDVQVKIPKFTMRKRVDLIPELKELGVSDLFSQSACDLTNLVSSGIAYVSDIIHEAVITVDEVGTEAAAATAVQVGRKRKVAEKDYKVFEADHSFVFYIRHVPTSCFVFMGEYHGV